MKIAIIGAGFTGLTAAYELAQKGHEVTIFEKSNDLGGLAGGFQIQGTNLEKTYHHIFKTDTDIIKFVEELGIKDNLIWRKSTPANYYNGKIYSFGTPKALLLFKPFSFLQRIRTGIVSLYLQKTNKWEKYQKISAYDWVKKMYGEKVTKIFWEPLLKGKFDKYYDQVSMAWLWARMHIRLKSRVKGENQEVLGYFDGGFNVITEAIVKKLKEKNVKIITGVNITEIRNDKSKAEIIFESYDKSKKESFDKIIATTPSHVFAKLIEKNKVEKNYLEKLNSINYLGAIVLVFSSSQKIGEHYWHNINDLSFPFLVFLNHTNLIEKEKYNGKYIYYIGKYLPHEHQYFSASDEEIIKEWFVYLKKIFPQFNEKEIIDKFLFKFKNAQHVVDLNYAEKIPDYKTPLKDVYLANFSQIFPEDRGTNYAVREGKKIAKIALED